MVCWRQMSISMGALSHLPRQYLDNLLLYVGSGHCWQRPTAGPGGFGEDFAREACCAGLMSKTIDGSDENQGKTVLTELESRGWFCDSP